jgi:hypothetical protein
MQTHSPPLDNIHLDILQERLVGLRDGRVQGGKHGRGHSEPCASLSPHSLSVRELQLLWDTWLSIDMRAGSGYRWGWGQGGQGQLRFEMCRRARPIGR